MLYRAIAGCALALIAVAAASVAAGERLTGAELEQRCRVFVESPEEPEGAVCAAFVQGFLAGLKAADKPAVADAAPAEKEGFAARAARTRAGGQLQRFRNLQGNEYCVPADVSGAEVIQRVTAYLAAYERDRDNQEKPIELVHRALAQTFPCNGA